MNRSIRGTLKVSKKQKNKFEWKLWERENVTCHIDPLTLTGDNKRQRQKQWCCKATHRIIPKSKQ